MSNDSNMKLCALLFGEAGHIITATPSLGLRTKVEVRVGTATPPCVNPYFGFTLIFSRDLGQVTSEKEGRGVCYAYDPSSDKPVPSDFTITVKFPRGSISCSHLPVSAVIQARFPKVEDCFDNDNAHITAINQSVMQDTLWVHREAELIAEERLLAYFVTPIRVISECHVVHLVIPVPKAWRELHDLAWLRLTAGNPLTKVKIHDISTPGHTGPALWTGKIIGSNNSAPELRTHPIQDHELIVRVRAASVPRILIRHYPNRRTADKALAQGTQN
ncbi:hypothetical protein ACJA88_013386 [Fusarium oxysporum]